MTPPTPWLIANALGSPVVAPTPAPVRSCALAATAVHPGAPPPRVIYTWTTAEQIAQLRTDAQLLVRTESPIYGQTAFALSLERHGRQSGDPASLLLLEPTFARHRYAWSQPWATSAPPAGERWGDQLIQIELRDEAWVGIFRPPAQGAPASDDPVWRFVDLHGTSVPTSDVLAHPERLAMVLHHNPAGPTSHPSWGTFLHAPAPFRELVVVNEAMVARFSYGTPQLRAVRSGAAEALEALAPRLPTEPPEPDAWRWSHQLSETSWRQPLTTEALSDPVLCWSSNLAMVHPGWLPTERAALLAAARLRFLEQGPPLIVEPSPR